MHVWLYGRSGSADLVSPRESATLSQGLIEPYEHRPDPNRRTARITPRSEDLAERRCKRMNRLRDEKTTDGRKANTLTTRTILPGRLALAGAALIAAGGLIHLLEAPEELEEISYLGLLFLANFGAAVVAAIRIYRNDRWGWGLGALVAGGAFAGYVISRTIGLPRLPVEEWLEPLGVLSLLVEGLFVELGLAIVTRPAKEVRID